MDKQQLTILEESRRSFLKALRYVFLFSFIANILMLALPIYTLQVLDRVISSRSLDTLFWLSLLMLTLFAIFGLFQAIRSISLVKLGEWLDQKLGILLLKKSVANSAVFVGASGSQNLRDLNTVKSFVTGAGINSFLDAPWSLVFIAVIFFIHHMLGFIALFGSIFLFLIAILNEYAVRRSLKEANEHSIKMMNQVEVSARNAEVVEAMGMMDDLSRRWRELSLQMIEKQAEASNRSAVIMATAKAFRMMLQIFIMGTGAYLVLEHELTPGGIIACSILAGRALAPFESAIGMWSPFKNAMQALGRLEKAIEQNPDRQQSMALPAPKGLITGEKVLYAPPGSVKTIIKGLNFEIAAGETIGLVGPSAAGKSTLAKLIAGVWKPSAGVIRLDGADVYTWKREDFGKYMGYVPQGVELFDGTIRDNIARFREDATDEAVVRAAQLANVHELILSLPNGYETEIGVAGSNLSAGQRQRIALARAFYGDPSVLVLDEPNSNLDDIGEAALTAAVRNAKKMNMTVIVISHRPSLLAHVDKIMVMRDGLIVDYGTAHEVLSKYAQQGGKQVAGGQPTANQIEGKPGEGGTVG